MTEPTKDTCPTCGGEKYLETWSHDGKQRIGTYKCPTCHDTGSVTPAHRILPSGYCDECLGVCVRSVTPVKPAGGVTCTCTAFIELTCPVHMRKPKLADGTEVTLKAGPWRKSRLGRNYNGRHRD